MQKEFKNLLKLGIALMVVLLFFTMARIYFYFYNTGVFSGNINFFSVFLYGIYYDLHFLLFINGLVIFLFFLPLRIRNTVFWQSITKILFVFMNLFVLIFYLLDAKFYNEISSVFLSVNHTKDIWESLEKTLKQIHFNFSNTWDLFLIISFVFIVLMQVFPSINNMHFENSKANKSVRTFLSLLGFILFFSGVYFHKYRQEQWQTALFAKMNPEEAGISLNSSYKLLHFYFATDERFPEIKDQEALKKLFRLNHRFSSNQRTKSNVVLLNIDNADFTGDELQIFLTSSGYSYAAVDNFFAKHKLSGLQTDELFLSYPAFMEKPLLQSIFAFKGIQTLTKILHDTGYKCFWFQKAKNKMLNAKSNFYGMNLLLDNNEDSLLNYQELHHKPYFVFVDEIKKLNELNNYLTKFQPADDQMLIVNYKSVKKYDFSYGKTYFLYSGDNFPQIMRDTITDLDIFPSIIDYLGINTSLKIFGKSIFKTSEKELFQYTGDDYIVLNDSLLLRYDGSSTKWMINYRKDPNKFFDLQDTFPVQKIRLENKIRAIIKSYENILKSEL